MKKKRFAAVASIGVAAVLTMAACSSGTASSSGGDGGSKELTVWLMQNTLTPASQKAIVKQFEDQTGAKLKIQIQQWDNINTKLTTALATDTPPDVVEIGNTDVPLFAANGALTDITKDKKDLSGGDTWLTGLEGPATVNGKLYAAPFYAGARAMIYNTKTWAAAGITAAPTTYDEMTADLDKVKAQNSAPDFSPLYLSGTYWYGGFSFISDAGGSIAKESGGKWTSELSSAASQKGLQEFKDFQNKYSTVASRTAPLDTPDPTIVFGTGKASAINGNGNSVATIVSSYPALKGQIGSFPLPSPNHSGKNAPTFLGGSDLGIAAKSKNQDLAMKFVKYITSSDVQIDQLSKLDGHIPISTQMVDKELPSVAPELKAFYVAAQNSYSTPAAPGWATIESDQSVLSFFSEVAAGTKSVAASGADFDKHLTTALNANK